MRGSYILGGYQPQAECIGRKTMVSVLSMRRLPHSPEHYTIGSIPAVFQCARYSVKSREA